MTDRTFKSLMCTQMRRLVTAIKKHILAALLIFFLPAAPALSADIPEGLMIDLDSLSVPESEFMCLALNDYFEARGESLAGRLAVAKVVVNRAMDQRFPSSICRVIKQNKARVKHRCQFSWYCDGRPDTPYNRVAWSHSLKLAAAVLQKDSGLADPTGGALWYHASFVHPKWANNLEVTGIVGGHIFYRDPSTSRYAQAALSRDPMVPGLHTFAEWLDARENKSTAVASR
ncbi:MAG: cell wall hydrolase [Rhodospirillaceae bacterium]